ncbi:COG complex component [Cristinia sonorae]|uniref:Conserved oligomeric Golgi complex subunit 2 n=1 Tax=Cristinia sonorae TaxID=1940300 RepID=A0A8K0V1S8_9AGAR|nr:COG complex component [Cristinia sonorae]
MSALLSPPSDKFDLDRLAEELEQRELLSPSSTKFPQEHYLPAFVPLSHDNPYLAADSFNVQEFLLSRAYTSLPDLRSELRDYLATLKDELVRLINDDYEAFISLSTDLRGEGARMERLQRPLAELRSQVLESQRELQAIQDSVQDKLKKRSALREEKSFLQLLLKISESVTRLESLLLIAAPSDEAALTTTHEQETDKLDERTRGNRAKHLSRVAAEYNQLLYHISKAQAQKSAFVQEIQWRIDRIKSTLSADLDHLFSVTIIALTEGKVPGRETKLSESDRAKWLSDAAECLRTYDALGQWRDAEEVLRRDIVRDFVKKNIYPGALTAPHSPVIPHTPMPATHGPVPHTARTPYTPFAAFASKQNPFDVSFAGNAHAHLLDDSDDPLAGLYNTLLKWVERDLKRVMEAAERVCVKGSAKGGVGGGLKTVGLVGGEEKDKGERFEIMANVVWAEIGKAVMDELGSIVFAAGKPDEFRGHYETTQAFIRALEFLAPSASAIEAMRSHPVYTAFDRRWQLPVYFQLRWKEIVTKLEDALVQTKLERNPTKANAPFATSQGAAVWEAVVTCWSADVYIPELSHRFWKLNLQLLSRYRTWLEASLPPLDHSTRLTNSSTADKSTGSGTPPGGTRSGTPSLPTEAASAESVAADEHLIVQLATAITDLKAFETQMWKLWREELGVMLPRGGEGDGQGDSDEILEEALKHALSKLLSIIPPLSSQIIHILSRRGCDALLPMRSIPSQFRAMSSSRRLPTDPSHFVSLIFKPLKSFFGINQSDGPAKALRDHFLKAYAEEVFEVVAQRYVYFLTAMKKTEESLRRLKKGRVSTFSLFGGSGSAREDESRADEEKIRAQMILDVEAFGRDAEGLGVDVKQSESYRTLSELAHAPLADEVHPPPS